MELDLNMLRPQERVSLRARLLFEREGFRQYHMGRFEEYGLYQENRRFWPPTRSSRSRTWTGGCWP